MDNIKGKSLENHSPWRIIIIILAATSVFRSVSKNQISTDVKQVWDSGKRTEAEALEPEAKQRDKECFRQAKINI